MSTSWFTSEKLKDMCMRKIIVVPYSDLLLLTWARSPYHGQTRYPHAEPEYLKRGTTFGCSTSMLTKGHNEQPYMPTGLLKAAG